jgi:IS5 family transposase
VIPSRIERRARCARTPADSESDLFRNRLDNLIDMPHELVRLSELIDWGRFDEAFGALYAEKGRPGLPTRLMVGLHLIKHARGLSDEQVCAQWPENAYFQYFSGETYFQTALPLNRTSMSVWRGRIGPEKLEALNAETLAAAKRAGAVEPMQMRRVTVDTTAQTKAIAHPTDSHLLLRAIEWLNRLSRKQGVAVRQSYLRVARAARREVGRLMHAGPRKQAERWVRKLRTWAGRLARDIERKTAGDPDLVGARAFVLDRVKRLLAQKRDDKNKLYALHAPEVECIAKGKLSRPSPSVRASAMRSLTSCRRKKPLPACVETAMPRFPEPVQTARGRCRQGRAARYRPRRQGRVAPFASLSRTFQWPASRLQSSATDSASASRS